MATCDLTIRLEEQKTVYLPGEFVSGTIEARVNDAVKCNGLKAGIRWKTFGKGDSEYEEIESETLFEGEWEAGTVCTEYFEFQLPAGPYTYHGHYLNVLWEVFARADIPWARDPETAVQVLLMPDPDMEPDWSSATGSTDHMPLKLREKAGRGPAAPAEGSGCAGNAVGIGCLLLLLSPVILLIVVSVGGSILFARGDLPLGNILPFVLIPLPPVLFIIYRVYKAKLARERLGAVTPSVEPRFVRAGGEINVSVSCKPDKATELRAATARLVATEVVTRRRGTKSRTFRHVVYEKAFELATARALPRGIPFQAGTSIPIPAHAPPSFYAFKNSLSWKVVVDFDIARWPDWRKTTEIFVHA